MEGSMDLWLIGGLVTAVAIAILYRKWPGKRPLALPNRYVMTETADGEPLQFLVRSTRKTR